MENQVKKKEHDLVKNSLKIIEVPHSEALIKDEFWSPKLEMFRNVTLIDVFSKFEKSGAFSNFDRVANGEKGGHSGLPWYDGLVYETICSAADMLATRYDESLDKRLNNYIQRISAAQAVGPDGYINTWVSLEDPEKRWGDNGGNLLWQHDLYNAGALVEAGIHHYKATKKLNLLRVAVKFAEYLTSYIGTFPKRNIVPAHPLPEVAFVELFRLFREFPSLRKEFSPPVNEIRYLELATFWIENRGNHEERPNWGEYAQDHKPLIEQEEAVGHAVRAVLLYTGLVAVAKEINREDYLKTAQKLWENVVGKKMYITGGVGSFRQEEKFGANYQLPNNGYLETCAAAGMVFWAYNMYLAFGEGKYVDVIERELYNGLLVGVSKEGDAYSYDNPLEWDKNIHNRWEWHECPCCPPMFLKVFSRLGSFIYSYDDYGISINLFVQSTIIIPLRGQKIKLKQETFYPWSGKVKIIIYPERTETFELRIRIPEWCKKVKIRKNGHSINSLESKRGYIYIKNDWKMGDTIEFEMDMPIQLIKAHPLVEADLGRVAIQRGPVVYCVEAEDNPRMNVWDLEIPKDTKLSKEHKDILGGIVAIKGEGYLNEPGAWEKLYLPIEEANRLKKRIEFTAIPYYAWDNRTPGPMKVWIKTK